MLAPTPKNDATKSIPTMWDLLTLLGNGSSRDIVEEDLVRRLKDVAGIRRVVVDTPDPEMVAIEGRVPIAFQLAHKRTSKPPIRFTLKLPTLKENMRDLLKLLETEYNYESSKSIIIALAMLLYMIELHEEGFVLLVLSSMNEGFRDYHINIHLEDTASGTYCPCCYGLKDAEKHLCVPIPAAAILAMCLDTKPWYFSTNTNKMEERPDTIPTLTPETLFAALGRLVDKRIVKEVPYQPLYREYNASFGEGQPWKHTTFGEDEIEALSVTGGFYMITPHGERRMLQYECFKEEMWRQESAEEEDRDYK